MSGRPDLSVDDLVAGIQARDPAILGRAITLMESQNRDHRARASALLDALLPHTGGAHRVGITGVPGVGKSTFIEALGTWLTEQGHRVAVLAVDPSSTRTGGSILGDKTRMTRLASNPDAFIRPSPTSGTLGGVASRTREAILVCEAAGFDVILVETVGVGQSELTVAEITDFFLVLMLSGAGDELQGIKRGVMELADALAINKADGDGAAPAKRAAATYRSALHYLHPPDAPWTPEVLTCSALQGDGLEAIWETVCRHRETLTEADLWEPRRQRQRVAWFWSAVDERLREHLREHHGMKAALPALEASVRDGTLAPTSAALKALDTLRDDETP